MYFRKFVLGAAAAFAVISAAHAEDAVVPNEFEQQQAMGVCDAYGTGFAKLPGTNTCVKVSGQVRYEKHFSGSDSSGGRTTLNFETRSD
ncbi:porin [Rhizobium sp. TH2]|uniref:porin n=1 Tax=Rhizobium sp. TH2 TaxID=2775403 RepID=UPI0021588C1A|nr:porin [Rhizobium sp. TH2]UVC09684.1 porin [Rhizobium sp. TH2]